MASWVRWQPENIYRPCTGCPEDDSVFWPSRLATPAHTDDEYGRPLDTRRNEDCSHELLAPSYFVKTGPDDPRAEWREIDWDPPASA